MEDLLKLAEKVETTHWDMLDSKLTVEAARANLNAVVTDHETNKRSRTEAIAALEQFIKRIKKEG